MYKVVLTHEIVPGKLSALKRWIQNADRERAAKNPAYKPYKRYITVIGSVTRFQLELEWETMPEHPIVWSEVVEDQGEFKDFVVAGMSECYVLKELETEG
jgi:hypothetical protein